MVASKSVKKHQTNTENNCRTITISCCGLVSGVDGPRFYLVKAENIDIQTFKGDFAKRHKAPPGLKVIITPNAYMTDKVWNELVPVFSKVLCDLLVINDYPELWLVPHLKGGALKIFADYKILILKEEGDTYQVCQAHDKDMSPSNK